jgi:hypothetical protein
MPISGLDVQPMTKQVLRILNKRGRVFQKVALKHHYMQYEKFMLKRGAFSDVRSQPHDTTRHGTARHDTHDTQRAEYSNMSRKKNNDTQTWIKADGRVMVDISTFNRMNPEYTEFGSSAHDTSTQQQLQQLMAAQQVRTQRNATQRNATQRHDTTRHDTTRHTAD